MTTDNNPQQEGQEIEREVSECPMCGSTVFVERRQKRGRRTSRTRDTVLVYVPTTDGELQSRLAAAQAEIERMRRRRRHPNHDN